MKEVTIMGIAYKVCDETDKFYLLADDTKVVTDKKGSKHTLHRLLAKASKFGVDDYKPEYFAGAQLGYVEHAGNVQGNAIVDSDSMVWGQAVVCDDAVVCNSVVCSEEDGDLISVRVCGSAKVSDSLVQGYLVRVGGNARIRNAKILDYADVFDAEIYGDGRCMICDRASVTGTRTYVFNSMIAGDAKISEAAYVSDSRVFDSAMVFGNAKVIQSKVYGYAQVFGDVAVRNSAIEGTVCENAEVERAVVRGDATVCGDAHIKPVIIEGEVISKTPQQGKTK